MVIERLKQFIDAKGLTNNAFERGAGLSNATIAGALNRGGTIRCDMLEKILTAYPDLNPTWLMVGKGDMFVDEELEKEVERLREENRRLREIKFPQPDAAPMAEVLLKFIENQRQYNEIMKEMTDLYNKQMK